MLTYIGFDDSSNAIKKNLLVYKLQSDIRHRLWSSRIDYFENNRQNMSSHLELVISKNSQILLVILINNKQKIDYVPK